MARMAECYYVGDLPLCVRASRQLGRDLVSPYSVFPGILGNLCVVGVVLLLALLALIYCTLILIVPLFISGASSIPLVSYGQHAKETINAMMPSVTGTGPEHLPQPPAEDLAFDWTAVNYLRRYLNYNPLILVGLPSIAIVLLVNVIMDWLGTKRFRHT